MEPDILGLMHQVRKTQAVQGGTGAKVRNSIAGSFVIPEDVRPRVINLDFPALPVGAERSQKLIENGTLLLINPLGDS